MTLVLTIGVVYIKPQLITMDHPIFCATLLFALPAIRQVQVRAAFQQRSLPRAQDVQAVDPSQRDPPLGLLRTLGDERPVPPSLAPSQPGVPDVGAVIDMIG
jgi:hypothetical protein